MGQKFFVRFLEELKKPKSPFEINWPSVYVLKWAVLDFQRAFFRKIRDFGWLWLCITDLRFTGPQSLLYSVVLQTKKFWKILVKWGCINTLITNSIWIWPHFPQTQCMRIYRKKLNGWYGEHRVLAGQGWEPPFFM